MSKMQSMDEAVRDQIRFAKQGADNLAKRHHYIWTEWLKGRTGRCTAAFDREGERWSLSFEWTPDKGLADLAKRIEAMDHYMRVSMTNFESLKRGAMMAMVEGTQH